MTIRPATKQDLPQIAALMHELGYPTTPEEMAARYRILQQQPDHVTLVAEMHDEVVGTIGFAKHYFWEQNGFYVRIQALVISESFRGYGIGQRLVEACEEWAKERGAVWLQLNCGNKASREAAHKFYPQIGFTHTSSGYVKRLH